MKNCRVEGRSLLLLRAVKAVAAVVNVPVDYDYSIEEAGNKTGH